MPTYRVTDSVSGVTLDLTGDSPPTEQELQDIFRGYKPPEEPKPEAGATEEPAPVSPASESANSAKPVD